MINEAMAFAIEAHEGQLRKGTNIPYILHPMEAGAIVAGITEDPELIAAAILHDTIEDCPNVTLSMVRDKFGEKVAGIVDSESEDKRDSWEKRKGDTIKALMAESDIEKKIVALADKLSNMRAMYRDYMKLGDELWQRFNMKDKKMQGWYYKGLRDALKDLDYLPEYQEFARYINIVFN